MSVNIAKNYMLDEVKVVLADARQSSRAALRDVLYSLGLRQVHTLETVKDFRSYLNSHTVDLLVTSVDLADGNVCEMISKLRHGEWGDDPFLPIIATTWTPTHDAVKKVVDSGADLLYGLPISLEQMWEGMERLIRRRKHFVVTTDYVGPDRRSQPRSEGMQVPLLMVPNRLRWAATGEPETCDVNEVMAKINEQKVERHAYQISYLTNIIIEHFSGEAPDDDIRQYLARLKYVVDDMNRRVVETRHAHQAELCQSLISVARRVAKTKSRPQSKDLDLLSQVSLALQVAFNDDADTVQAAKDIAREVGQIRAV